MIIAFFVIHLFAELNMPSLKSITIASSFVLFTYAGGVLADDNTNILSEPTSQNIAQLEFTADLGWGAKYVSEGRNNLENGGIYWSGLAAQYEDLTTFARVGRADSEHYVEWQFGLEYAVAFGDNVEAAFGYQRLEVYGDERGSDNEFFSSFVYTGVAWLTPSVNYTYATEAGGSYVELGLHSAWDLSAVLSVTPYIIQGLDYQYATEAHDGRNNLQFGIETEYTITPSLNVSGHISHSIAQEDIELEAGFNGSELNETFAGIYINWTF